MSTIIFIKVVYTLLGKVSFGTDTSELQFDVPVNADVVKVNVLPEENQVVTLHKKDVSNKVWEFMQTGNSNIPSALRDEYSTIKSSSILAATRILTLVKYNLGCIDLDERLVSHKTSEWSLDNIDWKPLPLITSVVMDSHATFPLNKENANLLQQCINSEFEPFIALRHLHKARNEDIPHYKWIDATIAAELAIKEFLIRFKPEIATLILEMPSPPIQKLYGSVLESLGLQRSPKVKEISKGVEIRNKLVHRPEGIKISGNEANQYVHDVEITIRHLIHLLHPNDRFIKYFYYFGDDG